MSSPASPIAKPIFVLVHGGWHGAWCYNRTASKLREDGHVVYAPTLTGLAERQHLLSRQINLSTHIDDVANLIEHEDLHNVVLCGHSYGGMVISGVAERCWKRLRSLMYLDAILPQDGQCMIEALPPDREVRFRQGAAEKGLGWLVPPISAAAFNVNANDAAWVDRMCTMHPLRCFEEPVRLSGARDALPKHYVVATDFPSSSFLALGERLRNTAGWKVSDIHTGHDVMVDSPLGLARLLVEDGI